MELFNKEYRSSLLIILVGSLVVYIFYIWFLNCVPSTTADNINSATTLLFLFWAFTAALWSAREAFDQKQIANKTIKEIRKQNDYEMRPYLRLQWNGTSDSIYQLINEGRGMAIDVVFESFIFFDQNEKSAFKIKSRPLMASNGITNISKGEILEGYKGLLGADSSFYGYLSEKLKDNYRIKATYKDLENHKYEVEFVSDESYNDKFRIEKQKRTD